MDIDFTLTRKQYIKQQFLQFFRKNIFFLYIILFLLLLIYSVLAGGNTIIFPFIYLILAIILYVIIIVSTSYLKKNRDSFVKTRLSFNEETVVEKTSTIENVYKWESFKRWEHISGLYVLYLSRINILFVPKSDIKEDEIPAFENMLDRKIGVPKSRIWSWKIRGALFLSILLSLTWLFILAMLFLAAPEHTDKTPVIITSAGMFIIIVLFVTEFYFILRGKKSGNKTMTKISSVFLSLTMIILLLVTLTFFSFSLVSPVLR